MLFQKVSGETKSSWELGVFPAERRGQLELAQKGDWKEARRPTLTSLAPPGDTLLALRTWDPSRQQPRRNSASRDAVRAWGRVRASPEGLLETNPVYSQFTYNAEQQQVHTCLPHEDKCRGCNVAPRSQAPRSAPE